MRNIAFIQGEEKNISDKTIVVKCHSCDRIYKVPSGSAIPMCHDKFMNETEEEVKEGDEIVKPVRNRQGGSGSQEVVER